MWISKKKLKAQLAEATATLEQKVDSLRWADKEIVSLTKENTRMKEQIEKLENVVSGERVCDAHCSVCENAIVKETEQFYGLRYGTVKQFVCKLDIKCKDFVEQKDNQRHD